MKMQVIAKQDQASPKGNLLGYHVYWGLGEMRQTGPLYTDYDEAILSASYIRSNTEVRPVYAKSEDQDMVYVPRETLRKAVLLIKVVLNSRSTDTVIANEIIDTLEKLI